MKDKNIGILITDCACCMMTVSCNEYLAAGPEVRRVYLVENVELRRKK